MKIRNSLCFFSLISATNVAYGAAPDVIPKQHWVHVPGGRLVRPDCVHVLPNSAIVDVTTNQVTLNGSKWGQFDACAEPSVSIESLPKSSLGSAVTPSGNSGWILSVDEKLSLAAGDNIAYLSAQTFVPPAPTTNDGQTVYLWSGIETDNCYSSKNDPGCVVLQPVLGWGPTAGNNGAIIGGPYWWMASYLATATGSVYVSPLVQVNTYDWLTEVVQQVGQSNGQTFYGIQIWDGGTPSAIGIWSRGLQWDWAFSSVLEAWYIAQCSDFPSTLVGGDPQSWTYWYNIQLQHGYPNNVAVTGNWAGRTWAYYLPDYYNGPNCSFYPYVGSNNTGSGVNELFWTP